ncbi:MAG TPA: methyltransferase domain-containing protein [Ignavibacteriales bacterium]|nr:methyltransferase domain-containing protein [Ignavibacteriales bacterium]
MRDFSVLKNTLNETDPLSMADELSFWSAPFGLKLLDVIRIKPGMNVLDIGFGFGFPLIEAAVRLGKSSKIYGIDPWEDAFRITQNKIQTLGLENIELILGVAENVPLPEAYVDLIMSNNGINNVQDLSKVLSECSRIAKPGAQFAATVNLPETMIEFYSIFMDVLSDFHLGGLIPEVKEHIHKKRLPVEEIEELLVNNGFELSEAKTESFTYRFTDGTAMFEYPFIRNNFMNHWLSLVPDDRVQDVFCEIENRMNLISSNKGEWSLTVPFVTLSAVKK